MINRALIPDQYNLRIILITAIFLIFSGLILQSCYSLKTKNQTSIKLSDIGTISGSAKVIKTARTVSTDKNYSDTVFCGYHYFCEYAEISLPFEISEARKFSNHLAAVQDAESGLWGYILVYGNLIDHRFARVAISPVFRKAKDFIRNVGIAAVQDAESGLWGYITQDGEWLIQPAFKDAKNFAPVGFNVPQQKGENTFISVIAAVQDAESGLWGYINNKGKWLIQPAFKDAREFVTDDYNSLIAAVQDIESGLWGYIGTLRPRSLGEGDETLESKLKLEWFFRPAFKDAKDWIYSSPAITLTDNDPYKMSFKSYPNRFPTDERFSMGARSIYLNQDTNSSGHFVPQIVSDEAPYRGFFKAGSFKSIASFEFHHKGNIAVAAVKTHPGGKIYHRGGVTRGKAAYIVRGGEIYLDRVWGENRKAFWEFQDAKDFSEEHGLAPVYVADLQQWVYINAEGRIVNWQADNKFIEAGEFSDNLAFVHVKRSIWKRLTESTNSEIKLITVIKSDELFF